MLRRTAIALTCALLLLAAAACSSSDKGAQQTPTTAKHRTTTSRPAHSTTTRPSTPTTAGITVPPPPELSSLILGTGPPGYEQQADDIGDTGPTDLDKAAEDDNSDTARATLQSAGFQDGYQRQWTSIDSSTGNTLNQDFVFLYRFATPEGAAAWMQHWRVNLITTNTSKTRINTFTPPEIPGAVGLSAINAKQGSTGVVLFTKGPYAVQALVVGGPSVDQTGSASDMAFAQYQHLP